MNDYYWRLTVRKGYDPNQPRVPAGDSRGGQWTSTGGSTDIPVFTSTADADAWLKENGYNVGYKSVEDLIDARWQGYRSSPSFERSIENEMLRRRSEIHSQVGRPIAMEMRGRPREEIMEAIYRARDEALEKLRPQLEKQEKSRFYDNWRRRYQERDVLVEDENENLAMLNSVVRAHSNGRIKNDVPIIFERDPDLMYAGTYQNGLIKLSNTWDVQVGLSDTSGKRTSTSDFYRVRDIGEQMHSVADSYDYHYEGILTHEYGHHLGGVVHPDVEQRANKIMGDLGRAGVAELFTLYSGTNEVEFAAETYALKKHRDFESLSKRQKDIIREIWGEL